MPESTKYVTQGQGNKRPNSELFWDSLRRYNNFISFSSHTNVIYFMNDKDQLHRVGGPAVLFDSGLKLYFHNGKLHRTNGPAVVWEDGHNQWWVNNKLHRVNGPALIGNGWKEWYFEGKKHRDGDEPSYISTFSGGEKRWYKHGLLHRDDNPAIVGQNCQQWYKNGKIHRVEGPASIWLNHLGHIVGEEWYSNGKKHRVGEPACSFDYPGKKEWWFEGKRHRTDGPAIEWGPQSKRNRWYVGGVQILDIPNDIRWQAIRANPESIALFQCTTRPMQEFVIDCRPDLISKIKDLDPELQIRFKHDLDLSGITL
jgi:hypothetical protein